MNAEQEEFLESLERWLRVKRDEYAPGGDPINGSPARYGAIDDLLDEVRDNAVMGKLPWTV